MKIGDNSLEEKKAKLRKALEQIGLKGALARFIHRSPSTIYNYAHGTQWPDEETERMLWQFIARWQGYGAEVDPDKDFVRYVRWRYDLLTKVIGLLTRESEGLLKMLRLRHVNLDAPVKPPPWELETSLPPTKNE